MDCSLQFKSEQEVLPPGGRKSYNFDRVFDDLSSQEEVKIGFFRQFIYYVPIQLHYRWYTS